VAETKVVAKVVQCRMGTGQMIVSVEKTCKICPHFKEIIPKNTAEGIPEKVLCIVPRKKFNITYELTEINFEE
jgi:hypothetical protein